MCNGKHFVEYDRKLLFLHVCDFCFENDKCVKSSCALNILGKLIQFSRINLKCVNFECHVERLI